MKKINWLVMIMAGFFKRKYGLTFALVSLILGLPFFHFHPDNTHTHQSELSQHNHKGHFHSNELSSLVDLITHDSSDSSQGEEHHPHSDTDTGTNYFELNLQNSSNPLKTLKSFKSVNAQKSIVLAEPTLFRPILFNILTFEVTGSTDTQKERSPPFVII